MQLDLDKAKPPWRCGCSVQPSCTTTSRMLKIHWRPRRICPSGSSTLRSHLIMVCRIEFQTFCWTVACNFLEPCDRRKINRPLETDTNRLYSPEIFDGVRGSHVAITTEILYVLCRSSPRTPTHPVMFETDLLVSGFRCCYPQAPSTLQPTTRLLRH